MWIKCAIDIYIPLSRQNQSCNPKIHQLFFLHPHENNQPVKVKRNGFACVCYNASSKMCNQAFKTDKSIYTIDNAVHKVSTLT